MKLRQKATSLVLSACILAGTAAPAFAATRTTFNDVPANHWAYQYVSTAAGAGLVSGVGNNNYGPDTTLSNAHFVTVVCNLLYKTTVAEYQTIFNSSAEWWRPYVTAAYAKGVLTGTTMAEQRSARGDWNASFVEAEISRYDMAQIMANVMAEQKWQSPTTLEIAAAKNTIPDWNSVPTNYQNAVATVYAKKFVSGMDSAGNFKGESSMNRAQAAVVLCKLMDAEKAGSQSENYTNTTLLVNGKEPTEENVYSAMTALQLNYLQGSTWDITKTYSSNVLGIGIGSQGFAYMLSDKVFGTFSYTTSSKFSELKPGDMIFLRNQGVYITVLDVDKEEITYVSSGVNGVITWRGRYDIDSLTSRDTIYSRYTPTKQKADDTTLADGKKPTETNAYNLLMDVQDEYDHGDNWEYDDRYDSKVFGSKLYGNEAFAAYVSDEIFGTMGYETHTKIENVKTGDMVYLKDEGIYVIVQEPGNKSFDYMYARSSDGRVYWDVTLKYNSAGSCTVYTRYEGGKGSSNNSSSSTLSDGSKINENNAYKLLMKVENDYEDGDNWNVDKAVNSSVFGKKVYGNQGFAAYVSDEIFDDLSYKTHKDIEDVKVGDIVYLKDDDLYVVVQEANTSSFVYMYARESDGRVYWGNTLKHSRAGTCTVYTRYDGGSSSNSGDTLYDGSKVNDDNVYKLLMKVENDYEDGDYWNVDSGYKSKVFGSNVKGSEGYAAYVSDKIFGSLSYTTHKKIENIKVGDMVYLNDEEIYVIIQKVGTSNFTYTYATERSGRVYWGETMRYNDVGSCTVYTRY